ncbi:MAG: HAMP domain-containing sensor histidine kinase, partial [Acetivibrio sp.]
IIGSVLASTEILFQQKEVILRFEEKEPVYVWADEYMVEEVITNYISNALNHVDGKRIVEVKIVNTEGKVRIAVFNTGARIPDEDIDRIWDKFYKVDKARTREYGGSGIGLSIVKAIMISLNQKFGVVNHETGVEFWFELDCKN